MIKLIQLTICGSGICLKPDAYYIAYTLVYCKHVFINKYKISTLSENGFYEHNMI